jgi:hypothetical protein
MPYLQETLLDRAIVAPSIYGDLPHFVTDLALVIEGDITTELGRFVREYAALLGAEDKYFRVDLYFDGDRVYVIEVNVEVADGWGVALNLLRAAGCKPCERVAFPSSFPTFPGDQRVTEFRLAVTEFALLGHNSSIEMLPERTFDSFDNKLYLARFSDVWSGVRVKIPRLYWNGNAAWEDIPQDVYLKFTDKFCPEAMMSRYSAKPRSELGKAKQMKHLFAEGRAIAQEKVSSTLTTCGKQVQAVAMCSSAEVVTGYIQVAPAGRSVINDKGTEKGVLVFL